MSSSVVPRTFRGGRGGGGTRGSGTRGGSSRGGGTRGGGGYRSSYHAPPPPYAPRKAETRGSESAAFLHALDVAMSYAMCQEAVMTAYAAINSLRQDTAAVAKSLSLYAPRGVGRDAFVAGLMGAVRDSGLEGAEVYTRPPGVSGVAFVTLNETGAAMGFVLATVSEFPVLDVLPGEAPLEDITWSLPLVCCGKTWYPRFLLPELQRIAFAANPKLEGMLSRAIADRLAAGWEMPAEKTAKWFTSAVPLAVTVSAKQAAEPAEASPSPDEHVFPAFSSEAWATMTAFASWLIQFEYIPVDEFVLPPGFNIQPLLYLHFAARHESAAPDAFSAYAWAVKRSPMYAPGMWTLLLLPYFMEGCAFRDVLL